MINSDFIKHNCSIANKTAPRFSLRAVSAFKFDRLNYGKENIHLSIDMINFT